MGKRGSRRSWTIGATAALLLLTLSLFDNSENGLDPTNAKAQAASIATTGSTVESCVQRELVRPSVEMADVRSPGKATQTENISINYGATPEDCRGIVKRNFQFEVFVKQIFRVRGKLRHVTGTLIRWYDSRFTQEEAGSSKVSWAVTASDQSVLLHCSPGKAKSQVILVNRGTIKGVASNRILGRKLWRKPFKIIGRPKGCPPNDRL